MEKQSEQVRVRIAPSPTGYLHLGTVRTALFNYLFAKKEGGKFVVRIEDTDTVRSLPLYESNILQGLKNLDLQWDEGPDIGGPYGPYRQSERGEIYRAYIERLLEEKKAFWCFCTKEEIEEEKKAMLSAGIAPRYGGTCKNLTAEEQDKKRAEGREGVIRLSVPMDSDIAFEDIIRGTITTNTSTISDFVIAKGLNRPLYNTAVVIDDYEMHISHVIRGEDHISNTPKQILIQKALGIKSPLYAHLPLVLAPDRSKLSKRNLETSFDEYVQAGYLPDALVNFLALIGWNPGTEQEILSRDEMIHQFNIKKIQKGGGAFNIEKLDWFNQQYLKALSPEQLTEVLQPFIPNEWKQPTFNNRLLSAVVMTQERMTKLSDFKDLVGFLFASPSYEPPLLSWKEAPQKTTKERLVATKAIIEAIDENNFTKDIIEKSVMSITEQWGRGELLWPLRVALSGQKNSPGPFEIAEALGKKETLDRINHAIQLCHESV